MKTISKLTILLSVAIATACNVNQDNNKSLDYDTLDVQFSAKLTGGSWNTDNAVGVLATCSRGNETEVLMSTSSIAAYTPMSASETSGLKAKTEDDRITSNRGDHNFRFYAFTPYAGGNIDLSRIPADIPADITFGTEVSQLYVAQKDVTGVIAPVAMEFTTPSCLMKLNIPDDIVNEDGGTVLKSMVLKPVKADAFTGSLAYSATYNIYTDQTTVAEGSGSSQITVNFGTEGYRMKSGYTEVSFLAAPFTVPEGGFQITFTATDGKTNMIPFLDKKAGEVYAGGSLIEQTLSSSGDGVIPCTSPVEWFIGGGGNHGWQDYPHITASKKLGVFNYDTQPLWKPTVGNKGTYDDDHIWTSGQPQATIQYIYSEAHPSPAKILTESNNFPQYEYSSPCVKGLWTGDYFEFKIPVKKFPANKTVKLSFPAYGRGAPLFWDIDYLDGETWKTVAKSSHTSPDGQFTKESTLMILHGNTNKQWDGVPVSVEIPFTQEIKSGYLQFRLKVADGALVTINENTTDAEKLKTCKQITAPVFDGNYLFAFVNISKLYTSVKVEW